MVILRNQSFILTFVTIVSIFCCHLGLAQAQINPMQVVSNAAECFSNNFIYKGCKKDYRLDESGHLDVPCEETNKYCNGPCLSETKSMLNCIDKMASNFLFLNGASTRIIGNLLDSGCSRYSYQKETFIIGDDLDRRQGSSCGLHLFSSAPSIRFQPYAISLIVVVCCLLLFQHV